MGWKDVYADDDGDLWYYGKDSDKDTVKAEDDRGSSGAVKGEDDRVASDAVNDDSVAAMPSGLRKTQKRRARLKRQIDDGRLGATTQDGTQRSDIQSMPMNNQARRRREVRTLKELVENTKAAGQLDTGSVIEQGN